MTLNGVFMFIWSAICQFITLSDMREVFLGQRRNRWKSNVVGSGGILNVDTLIHLIHIGRVRVFARHSAPHMYPQILKDFYWREIFDC